MRGGDQILENLRNPENSKNSDCGKGVLCWQYMFSCITSNLGWKPLPEITKIAAIFLALVIKHCKKEHQFWMAVIMAVMALPLTIETYNKN